MKGKQLALVLVLLLAIGGAALFLNHRNISSWQSSAHATGTKLLEFPLNDVSHITIKGGGAEVNLIKKEDVWTVAERASYPADFEKVSSLVRRLSELRPVQDVKIGASQLARLQLGDPTADPNNSSKLVELKAGERRLGALLLGKPYLKNSEETAQGGGFPVGRYVMAQDGSNRVFLISETFDQAVPKPEQWIDRDFIKIDNPKRIVVVGPTLGMRWTIERENTSAPWKLLEAKAGEDLDPSKLSSLGTLFAGAFADVLAPDAPVAETGLDKPATVQIESFDNFVYELRVGKLMDQNYPVLFSVKADLAKERITLPDEKAEDKTRLDSEFQAHQQELADKLAKEQKLGSRPYLISRFSIEQFFRERSTLLMDKTPSTSPAPASPAAKGAASPAPSVTTAPVALPSPSPATSPKRPRK